MRIGLWGAFLNLITYEKNDFINVLSAPRTFCNCTD